MLASLASFHTRSPRFSLALRAARLACSARFARRLASAGLRSRFARACRLACLLRSPSLPAARFARPAFPAACSTRCLSCCPPSLRSGRFSCVLAPLAASPAVLSLCSSARLLLALLDASTAARFARRRLLRLLLASLAVYLLDLSHSPCPPRLLQHFSARASSLPRSSQSLADLHYFPYWSCGFITTGGRLKTQSSPSGSSPVGFYAIPRK